VGLKENLSMVKDELSAEEKFFAGALRVEGFVRKYKLLLLATLVVILLAGAVWGVREYIKNNDKEASNAAFLALQKNPNDEKALHILKKDNSDLYNVYMLSNAVKKANTKELEQLAHTKTLLVSDLAAYQLASLEKNGAALQNYEGRTDTVFGKMAILQSAYLLIQEGKIEQARQVLQEIPKGTPIANVAAILAHYEGKK
jgi:hypothetical protein